MADTAYLGASLSAESRCDHSCTAPQVSRLNVCTVKSFPALYDSDLAKHLYICSHFDKSIGVTVSAIEDILLENAGAVGNTKRSH